MHLPGLKMPTLPAKMLSNNAWLCHFLFTLGFPEKAVCRDELQRIGVLCQAGFTSLAHTEEDIDRTIEAAKEVFAEI